ncbi:MAG TPA: cytochrome C [Verrucomicrobiae bacterium]|jgi:mono/diheme cytochrome c family protein|nr:cytochrome C [Verrucomicrobiae bacterium]
MQRVLATMFFIAAALFPIALAADQWTDMLPAGDGQQETKELCSNCHNLQKIVQSRKTPQEWERSVNDMLARGAQIFPDEAEKIAKYLSASFPPGK